MRKPRVQILDHAHALLIGSTGVIVQSDFLPYNDTSRQNPVVDVRLDGSGYVTSAFLDQLKLIGFEESAEKHHAKNEDGEGEVGSHHPDSDPHVSPRFT